jgi:endonuclease III
MWRFGDAHSHILTTFLRTIKLISEMPKRKHIIIAEENVALLAPNAVGLNKDNAGKSGTILANAQAATGKESTVSASSATTTMKSGVARASTDAGVARSHSDSLVGTIGAPNAESALAKWELMWTEIEDMRKMTEAAVDSMGCEAFFNVEEARKRRPDHPDPAQLARFNVLVSLMLSSQTKDTETYKAMQRLVDWGLTVDRIIAVDDDELNEMIRNVGFHNKKVQYLKRTATILRDKHGGDVPNTYDDLIALPGVGPKMAHLTLQCAHQITLGVSVDTHVHRISERLGWTSKAKSKGAGRVYAECVCVRERECV